MTWASTVAKLLKEFPKLRVYRHSDVWHQRLLNRVFPAMADYTRVWGYTVFMSDDLVGTEQGARVMLHEAQHMRDFAKWGVLFWLTYLFGNVFIVAGPGFRAYWEMKAYAITIKLYVEEFGSWQPWMETHIVAQFTTSSYLWMLPFDGFVRSWSRSCAQLSKGGEPT